jgi:hypothetical protein
MGERRTATIYISRTAEHRLPVSAYAFHKWLEDQIALVPVQWSGSAKVNIENEDHGYSAPSYTAYFEVYYERPETDEEMAVRLKQERSYAQEREASERRQYAALKAKYEPGQE